MSKKKDPKDLDDLSPREMHRLLFLGLADDQDADTPEGIDNILRAADRDFDERQVASGEAPSEPEPIN